jgi:hypothetical protein
MGVPVLAPIIQKSAAASESSSVFLYHLHQLLGTFCGPGISGSNNIKKILCEIVNGIFIITRFVAWGTQFWNFEGCVEEKTV